MINVQIDTKVFNPAYLPYLEDVSRTQIYYGGSGSGKSVFLSQRCVYDLMQGGRNYLICRAVGRTIHNSVFNEVCKVIADWNVNNLFSINKTDRIITCSNGHQAIFAGLDDTEKVKSITPKQGVITDIWIEETTECEERTVKELFKRQRGGSEKIAKRLTMSFNPILQSHWIYEKYFSHIGWADKQTEYKDEQLSILKTWYIHNKFLTKADVDDLENEKDKYYYQVYSLGNWGILGNVIFTNWRIEDLSGMQNQFTNHRNGLDFGFSTDPAAVSVSHYDRNHKTIYIFNELYEAGLTNDVLADEIVKMIGNEPIVCDSAEPKSIVELRQHGVRARASRKGKDSVNFGIQWLQQQTIVIDKNCINAKNEFQQYKWKEDKNGNAIRQPVEKNDHIIDATRYAYEDDALTKKATTAKIDWYSPPQKGNEQPAATRTDEEIDQLLGD